MIGAQGGRTPAGQGLGGYTAGFEEWPGPVQQPGCMGQGGCGDGLGVRAILDAQNIDE